MSTLSKVNTTVPKLGILDVFVKFCNDNRCVYHQMNTLCKSFVLLHRNETGPDKVNRDHCKTCLFRILLGMLLWLKDAHAVR